MMASISVMPDRIERVISCDRGLPSISGEERRLVAILIPPSGLRISCATPAAISPSEASFSRWISRRWVSTCSVRSRSTPTVPMRWPRSSNRDVMATYAGKPWPWAVRPITCPLQPRPASSAVTMAAPARSSPASRSG
jgi:hypothetical protein